MKKIYSLMFAGALLLSTTGCDIDILNPNESTNSTFWKTPDDLKAGVNGCYSNLYKESGWIQQLQLL